jgi:hypothetical protein
MNGRKLRLLAGPAKVGNTKSNQSSRGHSEVVYVAGPAASLPAPASAPRWGSTGCRYYITQNAEDVGKYSCLMGHMYGVINEVWQSRHSSGITTAALMEWRQ